MNASFEEIILKFITISDLKNIVINYLSINNICRFLLEEDKQEELTIFQCYNSDFINENSAFNSSYFKAKNKKHGLLIYEKALNNTIINYEISRTREKNICLDPSEDLLLVKEYERKVIIKSDLKVFDKGKNYNFIDTLINEIIETDEIRLDPKGDYKTNIKARDKIEFSKNIIEIMIYHIYNKNSDYKIHFNLLKFIDGTEEEESDISLLD